MQYFISLNNESKYCEGTIIKFIGFLDPFITEVEVIKWGPKSTPNHRKFNYRNCKYSISSRMLRENFKEIPFNIEKVEIL